MKQLSLIVLLTISEIVCGDITHRNGSNAGDVAVTLSTGTLNGKTITTNSSNKAYVFLGVPYAEPPVGRLRYARTVPKTTAWEEPIDCFEYKDACMQNSSRTTSPESHISEDCLYANLFVGTNCTEVNPCPILLYIHGGAHMFDSPRMFPPELMVDNFASTGLVFVTIGYRLGTFGFWNTGNDVAAGNWAIYDMIEGLKWVQRELSKVGGDTSQITIMGHSSAATDVALLSLSPTSNFLFQRVVPMSGSAMGTTQLTDGMESNKQFAIKLRCGTEEEWNSGEFESILVCMRNQSSETLLLAQRQLDDETPMVCSPRRDGPTGLFPTDTLTMAEDRFPHSMMTGNTKLEFPMANYPNLTVTSLKAACRLVIPYLIPPTAIDTISTDKVTDLCVNFYENLYGQNFSASLSRILVDMAQFVPVFEEASSLRKVGAEVYVYSFDYVKRGMEGVAPYHSQDLTWVMGIHPFPFDDRDKQIANIEPAFFANFAKYGNPTPWSSEEEKWRPLRHPLGANYYSIDLPPKNREGFHDEAFSFWNILAPRIGGRNQLNNHTPTHTRPANLPSTPHRTGTLANVAFLADDSRMEAKNNANTFSTTTQDPYTKVDWQTAFWSILGVSILLAVALVFAIALACCDKQNAAKKLSWITPGNDVIIVSDGEMPPNESTPLFSDYKNNEEKTYSYR